MKSPFRILACDPGSTNFGFSVLEVVNSKVRIVRNGLLQKELLIHSLNEQTLSEAVVRFQTTFNRLVKATRADCIVGERYLIQRRGTTGESVNMMLAIMAASGKPMQIFMAATWKARLKKHLGCELDELYKMAKYQSKKLPDHAIDATMQGLFFCERELSIPLTINKNKLVKDIENTYLGVWPR